MSPQPAKHRNRGVGAWCCPQRRAFGALARLLGVGRRAKPTNKPFNMMTTDSARTLAVAGGQEKQHSRQQHRTHSTGSAGCRGTAAARGRPGRRRPGLSRRAPSSTTLASGIWPDLPSFADEERKSRPRSCPPPLSISECQTGPTRGTPVLYWAARRACRPTMTTERRLCPCRPSG